MKNSTSIFPKWGTISRSDKNYTLDLHPPPSKQYVTVTNEGLVRNPQTSKCHVILVVTGIRGGKKITHLDTSNPPRIHLKEPQGRLEAEPVSPSDGWFRGDDGDGRRDDLYLSKITVVFLGGPSSAHFGS